MVTNFFNKNNTVFNNLLKKISMATRTRVRNASLNKKRWNKNYLLGLLDSHLIHYPTPIGLTYAWSFGSLAGICLVIQIISGLLLSIHYIPTIESAFSSVEYIMRDVPNGWFIRYVHANGASMFFIVIYAHIFRGLYYGSYMKPRQLLWCSGVVIFLLLMGAAFTGYVLPWGQMSFWGATVITSMVTVLPGGQTIVEWLWGGYTVNAPTLRRFYTVHFLLPFIIAGVTIIHLALLHKVGSTSPIGSDTGVDDIPFYPYYFAKDLFAFTCFLFVFGFIVFYYPNFLNHPDNYIPADPMETPKHLVPEWYFLPFYAILRSIPHKAGGISAMLGSILVLFLIPFTYTGYIRNTTYRPLFKVFYWLLVADFLTLLWVGQAPIKDPFIELGQLASIYYFSFFTFIIPVVGIIETKLATYNVSKSKNLNVKKIYIYM
jgi:ubiquinol-cytochrome c reductase cytochrome b subunit